MNSISYKVTGLHARTKEGAIQKIMRPRTPSKQMLMPGALMTTTYYD